MAKKELISCEVNRLKVFICDLFKATGVNSRHSEDIFSSILYAEQRGISSHGFIRIPYYLRRLEKGGVNPRPHIRVLTENKSCALMDGDGAMGQISGTMAMKKAISLAGRYNVGIVSLRRGSHFGVASYYSSMALKKDYIGIAICNTTAMIAPTGGRQAMIGNNPISVAVPSAGKFPVILDIALSILSQGKFLVAHQQGKSIPLGMALDRNGNPTTNPLEALTGTVLPIGGYKGYGLALIADILCGVLSGGSFGPQVGSVLKGDESKPEDKSFFFLALKVSAFCPVRKFKDRVAQYVELIKASQLAPGSSDILVPGEKEWRYYQKIKDKPVTIEPKVHEEFRVLAKRLGVKLI